MNTNHLSKNKQLSDTLIKAFETKINLSRIKLISLFILALCKARTVCFSKLVTYFDSPSKSDSCLRRIQRFFAKFDLNSNLIAKFIFNLLPHKGPYQLVIDRTNWEFGQNNINIFMLGIVHKGLAYPLLFNMLGKKGASNCQERIDLIERYISLFGRESIDCLLADREFVGARWIAYLNNNHIRYYIRIKENFWVKIPHTGKSVKASWMFHDLKIGESRFLYNVYYIHQQACYLAGSKIKGHDGQPELQIIISFNKPENAREFYKRRWQIETMFKAMKGSGFDIEATHLTDTNRIEKLLLIVMMAFVWAYTIGDFVHNKCKAITIKTHGRKAKSIFRYGLEYILKGKNEFKIPIFAFLLRINYS